MEISGSWWGSGTLCLWIKAFFFHSFSLFLHTFLHFHQQKEDFAPPVLSISLFELLFIYRLVLLWFFYTVENDFPLSLFLFLRHLLGSLCHARLLCLPLEHNLCFLSLLTKHRETWYSCWRWPAPDELCEERSGFTAALNTSHQSETHSGRTSTTTTYSVFVKDMWYKYLSILASFGSYPDMMIISSIS